MPLLVAIKMEPVREHDPDVRLHVTVPVPWLPLDVSVCDVPDMNVFALEIAKFDCVPFPMVIVVPAESFGRYESSPAFVARTSQSDPASLGVRVLLVTEHWPEIFCQVTAPPPFPPEVVRASCCP